MRKSFKHMQVVIVLLLVLLSSSTIFIIGYSNVDSRLKGPAIFGLSVFLPLSINLFALLLFSYIFVNRYPFLSLVLVFMSFLLKYVMPYYIFNGYINYDTPIHYLSALYLKDYGLHTSYHYHPWPSSLFLVNMLKAMTEPNFPSDYSLIAVTSRFLVPLTIYSISKRLLTSSKSVLVALSVLLIFEPFIIHPCPQITAVALTITTIIVFLNWLYGHEHRRLYSLSVLSISVATYHAVMPIALTLSILSVLVLYDIIPRLGIIKMNTRAHFENSRIWLVATILIIVVILYNIFITVFVTRSIVRTLELVIQGGEARLDVYPLTIESPELKWQYDVTTNIGRIALLLLIGIPSIIVAVSLLIKYFRSKLNMVERVVFAIAIVAGVNALIFIVFGVVIKTGLVERLYQISYILAPILTAYLYENTTSISFRKSSTGYLRRISSLLMLACVFTFIPLSIFTAPSYTSLYADAFGEPEISVALWISNHISLPHINLDGSSRLNQLIALYLYPHNVYRINLSITRYIEMKALKEDYIFPPGTIVSTRKPLSLGAVTIRGLSDTILNEYIANFSRYLNKLYTNSICEVFIAR